MLRRDLRAGELGLLLVALIVAVASLTSVGFFTDRVAQALKYEANQLLGGDIVLVADHPLGPEWRAEAGRRGLQAVVSATFTSMASFGDGAQLAGVKVIEDGHPLRGAIRLAPGLNQPDAPAKGIPASGEVWLDERLASALGARPGDVIGLGASRFRMAAVLSFESDRGANFFSLLPRLVINAVDLPATGLVQPGSGWTDIFIYPPAEFRAVDALITNFHLPRSTLLMLVAAFCSPGKTDGIAMILAAYRRAVAERMRFFSYGDAMLIE